MIADHVRARLHDARSASAVLRDIWTRYVAVHFISQAEEDAHLAHLERRAGDLLVKDRLAHRGGDDVKVGCAEPLSFRGVPKARTRNP